jgi:hypothetical protein
MIFGFVQSHLHCPLPDLQYIRASKFPPEILTLKVSTAMFVNIEDILHGLFVKAEVLC